MTSENKISEIQNIVEIDELIKNFKEIKIENVDLKIDSNKMATSAEIISALVNSFKIPDVIRDLPKYEGNRHTLYDFIDNVNEIITQCEEIIGNKQIPTTFLRAIRNKIQGEADEVLTMYGTPLIWATIRENLISHYADKRNETSLIRDLHTMYQGNESIEKYFSRIIDIQSTIIAQVKLNEKIETIKTTKESLYKEMCLATFLAGIKEPIGSMVRARNPSTIADAFSLCLSEQNVHYIKNKTFQPNIPTRKSNPPIPQIPFRAYQPFQYRMQIHPQHTYYNHKPFNSNNNPPFRNNFQNTQYQNKPPMALPPKPQQKIEPMDTTSNANKYKQYTNFQKPNSNIPRFQQKPMFQQIGPPRFQSQELFNMENPEPPSSIVEPPYECPQDNYYPNLDNILEEETIPELQYEIDDEVFYQPASESQLDS